MLGTKNKKGGKAYAMPWEWGIFGVVPSKGLMIVLNFYFYFYEKKKIYMDFFQGFKIMDKSEWLFMDKNNDMCYQNIITIGIDPNSPMQ